VTRRTAAPQRDVHRIRALGAVGVLALTCLAPAVAEAGNREGLVFGPAAATTAGAAAVTATGAEAAVYNPAGLIGARNELQIGVSAWSVRSFRAPEAAQVTADLTRDLRGTGLVLAPPAMASTMRLAPRVLGGFSVRVEEIDQMRLGIDTTWDDGDRQNRAAIDLALVRQTLRGGAAVGVDLDGGWSVGVGLDGVYRTEVGRSRVFLQAVDADGVVEVVAVDLDVDDAGIGIEAVAGVLWSNERWSVGATIRGPEVQIASRERGGALLVGAAEDVAVGEFVTVDEGIGIDTGRAGPIRMRAGVRRTTGRGLVAASFTLAAPVRDVALGADQDPLWNVQLGGRAQLSDRVALGGGVFTDRSAERDPSYLRGPVDFYGAAVGLHRRDPISLGASERVDSIVFETTVGLRYAAGFGRMAAFDITDSVDRDRIVDTRADEVTITLINGVRF